MPKYEPLTLWLQKNNSARIRAPLAALDELVDGGLPASARTHTAWWMGAAFPSQHVQKHAWEAAGYTVESVDIGSEVVTFRRL